MPDPDPGLMREARELRLAADALEVCFGRSRRLAGSIAWQGPHAARTRDALDRTVMETRRLAVRLREAADERERRARTAG
ncbi:MAG: hypothetical protein GEV11_05290 [Streptosporangiales bacterium]|nr:hypothetical protein [Streptosporangiales bacterium]